MKRAYLFISLLTLIGFSPFCLAQLEQSVRLEFKTSQTNQEYFDVTPLQKDGLLVTHREEERYGNEKWTFNRFDATLKEQWKAEYKLVTELTPVQSYFNQQYLFWLLQEKDNDKITVCG
ncbi:MAG: hypothetical protein R2822_03000 [Spirosomataceae bacterium]